MDTLGFTALQAGLGFLPMTIVDFAVALAIPRLAARNRGPVLLATGVAVTFAGMAWLSRIGAADSYLTAVALPMLLVGAGQGLTFAPLTDAGIAGVPPQGAGAASGLLNTAHQLGMALGLGTLVAVSAGAGNGGSGPAAVAAQVSTALTGATALLVLAFAVVVLVIAPERQGKTAGKAAAPERHQRRSAGPALP